MRRGGSIAHAGLGWPAIRQARGKGGVDPELVLGVGSGWLSSNAATLTFGALTPMDWHAVGRGNVNAARVLWPIAALYLLFGAAAYLNTSFGPHLLGFIAIGGLAACAAYAEARPA